ncbi:MAG: glycosyltransferase family 4 protein [Candidatus Acidiferrum sp.]|jgi:glycosyltransferase involved in cell wall biosynthesis
MKILFHHRIRSKDGQFVHLEELTLALRGLGHEIILVGPAAIEKEEFGAEAGIVASLKRNLPKFLYEFLEFCYSFLAYARLRAAIRRHKPDCIYERCNLFQVAGAWAKRTYKLPMLLEVNAPLLEERQKYGGLSLVKLARWSQNYVWHAPDYLLPVTEVLAGYLRRAEVPESKIIVIPNGVNLERFERVMDREQAKLQLGLEGRLVLGFTGFVREWHGLERVIDLIAQMGDAAHVHLLLVGDGPARQALEDHARSLGVERSITVTGVIPRNEVARYIAAFDVALQPAVVPYASPLKLFEYMVLGCAIVAPAMPNLCEILVDGENALLFDPEKPESFSSALSRVCSEPVFRDRIGKSATKTIIQRNLTWENNAKIVVGLFEKLGAGKRTARTSANP